jgi:DNA-binding response OmpR family regulator
MKIGSILVVEDECPAGEGMASILRKTGLSILGPFSALEDALANSRQSAPDLILIEITFRVNYEWLRIACTIWDKQGIPVAFMSSYPPDIIKALVTLTQPVYCVKKPYAEEELRSVIETVLKPRRGSKR